MQASAVKVNWRFVVIAVGVVIGYWIINRLSDKPVSTDQTHKPEHTATVKQAQDVSQLELEDSKKSVEHTENQLKAAEKKIELLSKLLQEAKVNKQATDQPKAKMGFSGKKLVHLDLKGAPPTMEFLLKLLPYFRKWGATGLLVEYEDMFPYSGNLEHLKSSSAYSNAELELFLTKAKEKQLDIVPLVQTFGHLEFVLKHEQFAKLRETPQYTNSLCPNNPESVPLVKSMIDQVLAMHPGIKFFHVGGDEVWNLKTCKMCEADKRNKSELFLHHMSPILKHIKDKGLTPLMWEDMMREWTIDQLKAISSLMEPMVWAYRPDLEHSFPEDMWVRYAAAFPRMWAASAFKGATEPFSNYVPIGFHVSNNLAWTKIFRDLPSSTTMVGIALTGWSRFDHYATLCELLPAGLPSLAFCLAALNAGEMSSILEDSVSEKLGFTDHVNINQRSFLIHRYKPPKGGFPGEGIYRLVGDLKTAVYEMNGVRRIDGGWFMERDIKNNFLSCFHLEVAYNKSKNSLQQVESLKKRAPSLLKEAYKKDVVDEWITDKLDDKVKEIHGYISKYIKLLKMCNVIVDQEKNPVI